MKKGLLIIALGALCWVAVNGRAGTIMDYVRPGVTVGPVSFPFHKQPDHKLTSVIHIKKAYLDHQRRGFFHIGILPVCALDGVTIEFQQTDSASATLQQVQQWLGAGGGRLVEMRGVKFFAATNILEAGRVKCGSQDQWELLDGVRLVCDGKETSAKKATLQISGDNAGRVILEDKLRQPNNFLGPPPALQR